MCAKKESEKRSTLVLISVTTFLMQVALLLLLSSFKKKKFYNKLRMLNDLPVYFLLFETSIEFFRGWESPKPEFAFELAHSSGAV